TRTTPGEGCPARRPVGSPRSPLGRGADRTCLLPPEEIEAFLSEQRPDGRPVAHLLAFDGGEADYLRAARKLGIRTAFPIRGWDNLTNKGLIRDAPDLVLAWNDLQAQEARELHGVPKDRIRITG